jgi:RNA polymerase sigma-70 factor (ECF subfamily)
MKGETMPRHEPSPPGLSFAAFTQLVERHQHSLHVFLRGLAGNPEQALDLVQDTFHDAWRATKHGKAPFVTGSSEDEIRRWLFHTAYCRAISALRRRRLIRWESLNLVTEEPEDPGSHIAFEDQIVEADLLRSALQRLAPQDVACLLLRVVQGLSAAEVGAIVGASADVVAKRLSRARQRLRAAYLAQELPSREEVHR